MNWSYSTFYLNDDDGVNQLKWIGKVTGSILVCLSLFGFLLNITLILIVIFLTKLQTIIDIHVLNLCVSDSVYLFSSFFFALSNIMGFKWVFGHALCHIVFALNDLNQCCSAISLSVMAIDRCIVVCYRNFARRYRKMVNAKCASVAVWIISFVVISPFIFITKFDQPTQTCWLGIADIFGIKNAHIMQKVYVWYATTVAYGIPLLIITACYFKITVQINKVGSQIGRPITQVNHMVYMYIIVFALLCSPFYIVRLVLAYKPPVATWDGYILVMLDTAMTLTCLNSCINPVLHGYFNTRIKKKINQAFPLLINRRRPTESCEMLAIHVVD